MNEEVQTVDVETPEVEVNDNAQEETIVQEVETIAEPEQVEESIEQKAERLEKETQKAQTKINRQKAAYSSQQKAYDELNRKLQELESKQAPVEPAKEPSIDDFESFEAYNEALVQHRVDSKLKASQEELKNTQRQQLEQQKQQERAKTIQQSEHEYTKENPKYASSRKEFVEYTSTMKLNPQVEMAMIDTAMREGSFPAVIDYFGSEGGENMDKFDEIAKLDPVTAGIEIYKLTQTLKSTKAPTAKKAPLPKPISKVSGTGKPNKALNDLSGDEFLKRMNLK